MHTADPWLKQTSTLRRSPLNMRRVSSSLSTRERASPMSEVTIEDSNRWTRLWRLLKGWQRTSCDNKCVSMAFSFTSCLNASGMRKVPCHQPDTVHGLCLSGKAFHPVPKCVVWRALHKLRFEEWILCLISSMYEKARSRVCVGCSPGEELEELQAEKLILWKSSMDGKGLRVDIGETKVLICGPWLGMLQKSRAKTPVPCVSQV